MGSRAENLAGNRVYSKLTTAHKAICEKIPFKKEFNMPGVCFLYQIGDNADNRII